MDKGTIFALGALNFVAWYSMFIPFLGWVSPLLIPTSLVVTGLALVVD
jgi:hypothetical protein